MGIALQNSRGSAASPTPIQKAITLAILWRKGSSTPRQGHNNDNAAQIAFTAAGTFSSSSTPGNILSRLRPPDRLAP